MKKIIYAVLIINTLIFCYVMLSFQQNFSSTKFFNFEINPVSKMNGINKRYHRCAARIKYFEERPLKAIMFFNLEINELFIMNKINKIKHKCPTRIKHFEQLPLSAFEINGVICFMSCPF